MKVFIRAAAPRISCPDHGVVVAAVPWAYHGSGFTSAFDCTAAWLATHLPRSTVDELLLIDRKTVGRCINKIKLIIRKAYGFREVKNLIDMVMLVCSNLRIPLEHREGRDGKKRSEHLKRYFPRAAHNYA